MKRALLVFVATRALLVLVAALPSPGGPCREFRTPAAEPPHVLETRTVPWRAAPDGALFQVAPVRAMDAFARWDSHYYLQIAAIGYARRRDGAVGDEAGFLPGYPLAVRAVASLLNGLSGGGFHVALDRPVLGLGAALLVSNAALLLAAFALRRRVAASYDEPTADRAATWLLVCPAAFFGSAALSESLFLWLSIESFFAAYRRRFLRAAVFGGLAAFTRPVGVLLFAPLLLASLERRSDGRRVVGDMAALLLVPAGFGAVLLWHHLELGDWRAYFVAQSRFGHGSFPTVAGLKTLVAFGAKPPDAAVRDAVQLFALACAAAASAAVARDAVARRIPWTPLFWTALAIGLPLLADDVISLPRYLFAVFPLYLGAARIVPAGRAFAASAAVSLALQAAGFASFAASRPILI